MEVYDCIKIFDKASFYNNFLLLMEKHKKENVLEKANIFLL